MYMCTLRGKVVPEMTYTAFGGMLNSTHSLIWTYDLNNCIFMPCELSTFHSSAASLNGREAGRQLDGGKLWIVYWWNVQREDW